MKLYELTDKGRALLGAVDDGHIKIEPRHPEPTNYEHCCSCCNVLEQRVRDRDAVIKGKQSMINKLKEKLNEQ